jgi:DNA-binding response OmpR family regulator
MDILLVDDNVKITEMLSSYLTLKSNSCVVSNDGKTGLSLMENEHFDAVVLDIAMPNFCGFDVLEKLNSKKIEQNIIVLTAAPLTNKETELLKAYRVKQILQKPVNLNTLLHSIYTVT